MFKEDEWAGHVAQMEEKRNVYYDIGGKARKDH
jgi:hypothetical protein